LKWLQDSFLEYLKDWEDSVHERKGFSNAAKKKMMLSAATLEGIRMTG